MNAMATEPDLDAFIKCFRLPYFDASLSEPEVDAHGEPVRHRRSRGKSRTGCDKCKQRRVKCDEKRPSCWNCTKLRLHCGFQNSHHSKLTKDPKTGSGSLPISINSSNLLLNKSGQILNTPNALPPPFSGGIYPPMNMSHLHLFHHFSTATTEALVLGPQIWKEKVVPSAFKHEYLMHAMMLMAASHLRHLQPQESYHRQEELEHFSQFIPEFNEALSRPVTDDNAYALCACSLLILQYSWACPELTDREANNAIDFGFGNLLGLYSGMRRLALTLLGLHDPYLYSVLFHRPIETIKGYSENTNIPLELEGFFTHCCQCLKWHGTENGNFNTRMDAARRLIPILSAFKLGEVELGASGLMPDISRYLVFLPVLSSVEYFQLLRNNDEASLVILLYYFALVRRLLSGKFWWMQERSGQLCEWLLARLGDKCERCVGWARKIYTLQSVS